MADSWKQRLRPDGASRPSRPIHALKPFPVFYALRSGGPGSWSVIVSGTFPTFTSRTTSSSSQRQATPPQAPSRPSTRHIVASILDPVRRSQYIYLPARSPSSPPAHSTSTPSCPTLDGGAGYGAARAVAGRRACRSLRSANTSAGLSQADDVVLGSRMILASMQARTLATRGHNCRATFFGMKNEVDPVDLFIVPAGVGASGEMRGGVLFNRLGCFQKYTSNSAYNPRSHLHGFIPDAA
jgi:hypothetical protein